KFLTHADVQPLVLTAHERAEQAMNQRHERLVNRQVIPGGRGCTGKKDNPSGAPGVLDRDRIVALRKMEDDARLSAGGTRFAGGGRLPRDRRQSVIGVKMG